jgi:hypothetical protein
MKSKNGPPASNVRTTPQENNTTAPGSAGGSAGGAAPGRTGAEPKPIAPSNTIGDNCNPDYFKALRWGVDSLYLSYQGDLFPEALQRLKALKELAQSDWDDKTSLAQCVVEGHTFEVKDRGAKLFPYILIDGAFHIQLSQGGKVPMAYVQIASQYLAHVGPEKAEQTLLKILAHFGNLTGRARVSRIDLFLDFVCPEHMEWDRDVWVTRASNVDRYAENGTFTGWVIGKGGILSARLYYKLLQATKNKLNYLLPLWAEAGWKEDQSVWRLEFQFRREVLDQMRIPLLDEALKHFGGLWSYATTEWLKLTIPSDTDKTRARWPVHPLWGYISSIDWETPGGPLLREFKPTRTPKDEQLYSRYFSALVSYMAAYGLDDLYQAQEDMTAHVVSHFMRRAEFDGVSFDGYVAERVAAKRREFNTGINDPDLAEKIAKEFTERRASAYRKAKDGM